MLECKYRLHEMRLAQVEVQAVLNCFMYKCIPEVSPKQTPILHITDFVASSVMQMLVV